MGGGGGLGTNHYNVIYLIQKPECSLQLFITDWSNSVKFAGLKAEYVTF